jgi:Phytanoyl-CoA dioxygenase (PhyH)
MQLRLETDGAVIIRRFLSDQDLGRIAEMAGNAFAFLEAGGGDTDLRETWISVGTIWLTNLEHCVAPELARDLVTLLSCGANRTLGLSYLVVNMCSIRRLTDWQKGLQWHTDYHGGGTHPYDPLFNIWLPLTAVGREQPSVELVRGSHRRMRELPLSEIGVYTDEWVAEHFPPTDRIAPELATLRCWWAATCLYHCGVVSSSCCDASVASATVFEISAAPPPKLAIACTS